MKYKQNNTTNSYKKIQSTYIDLLKNIVISYILQIQTTMLEKVPSLNFKSEHLSTIKDNLTAEYVIDNIFDSKSAFTKMLKMMCYDVSTVHHSEEDMRSLLQEQSFVWRLMKCEYEDYREIWNIFDWMLDRLVELNEQVKRNDQFYIMLDDYSATRDNSDEQAEILSVLKTDLELGIRNIEKEDFNKIPHFYAVRECKEDLLDLLLQYPDAFPTLFTIWRHGKFGGNWITSYCENEVEMIKEQFESRWENNIPTWLTEKEKSLNRILDKIKKTVQ